MDKQLCNKEWDTPPVVLLKQVGRETVTLCRNEISATMQIIHK